MKKCLLLFATLSLIFPLSGYPQSSGKMHMKITHSGNRTDTSYFSEPEGMSGTYFDEFPKFRGDMQQYFRSKMKYPEDAKKEGIHGNIEVSFVVDRQGKISNVHVSKKLFPSLDTEACRLVKAMPLWKPAMLKDKPIKANWAVEVLFDI
ncbi:MAG TPA: energy transducer TonB [Flavipsychrobacter sp.]|nr:energy transducer TonB [Flavipsychrobacter sp.]